MSITELVRKHGLKIKVSCGQRGCPAFMVVEDLGNGRFLVKYDNGTTCEIKEVEWLADYELIQ